MTMRAVTAIALTLLLTAYSANAAAKEAYDIEGVTLGMTFDQARSVLESKGYALAANGCQFMRQVNTSRFRVVLNYAGGSRVVRRDRECDEQDIVLIQFISTESSSRRKDKTPLDTRAEMEKFSKEHDLGAASKCTLQKPRSRCTWSGATSLENATLDVVIAPWPGGSSVNQALESVILPKAELPPPSTRVGPAASSSTPRSAGGRPSFDCTKARTATELAICRTSTLVGLDQGIADAFARRMAVENPNAQAALRTGQKQWIRTRDACGADTVCLGKVMSARLAELDGSSPQPGGTAAEPPAKSSGAPPAPSAATIDPLIPGGISIGMDAKAVQAAVASSGYNGSAGGFQMTPSSIAVTFFYGAAYSSSVRPQGPVTAIRYLSLAPGDEAVENVLARLNSRIGKEAACGLRTKTSANCTWKSPPSLPLVKEIRLSYDRGTGFQLEQTAAEAVISPPQPSPAASKPAAGAEKLVAKKPTYGLGEQIVVSWSYFDPARMYLLTFGRENGPEESWDQSLPTGGQRWGDFTISGQRKPGRFEVRAFLMDESGTQHRLLTVPIVVEDRPAMAQPSDEPLANGSADPALRKGADVRQECEKAGLLGKLFDCRCIGDKVANHFRENPDDSKNPLNVGDEFLTQCPAHEDALHASFYDECAVSSRNHYNAPTPQLDADAERKCQCIADFKTKAFLAAPANSDPFLQRIGVAALDECS